MATTLVMLGLLASPAADAGEPYLRPFKLLAERKAYNQKTLDAGEQLSISEFRLYQKNGTLPSRVEPDLIYVQKVQRLRDTVSRLERSTRALDHLDGGGGMNMLDAIVQPHLEVTEVGGQIVDTMKYVHARGVHADLRPLLLAAQQAARLGDQIASYSVSGKHAWLAANTLARAKSASETAVEALKGFSRLEVLRKVK